MSLSLTRQLHESACEAALRSGRLTESEYRAEMDAILPEDHPHSDSIPGLLAAASARMARESEGTSA